MSKQKIFPILDKSRVTDVGGGVLFTPKIFFRYYREEKKKVSTNNIFLCSYTQTCHHHANTWGASLAPLHNLLQAPQ